MQSFLELILAIFCGMFIGLTAAFLFTVPKKLERIAKALEKEKQEDGK